MLLIALHVDVDLDVRPGHRDLLEPPHQRSICQPRLGDHHGVVEISVRPILERLALPGGQLIDRVAADVAQKLGPAIRQPPG